MSHISFEDNASKTAIFICYFIKAEVVWFIPVITPFRSETIIKITNESAELLFEIYGVRRSG